MCSQDHARPCILSEQSITVRATHVVLGRIDLQFTLATAKSGVHGLGRSLAILVEAAGLPIRVNTLSPSWTDTQVRPNLKEVLRAISEDCQPASVVARAAVYLFANQRKNGETIFVGQGRYKEIEKAVFAPAYESIKGSDTLSDDAILAKMLAADAECSNES